MNDDNDVSKIQDIKQQIATFKKIKLKSKTRDGEREIKITYESDDNTTDIPLTGEIGKKIIERARDDSLRRSDIAMGHLLAEACIKSELDTNTPVFYSRSGFDGGNKFYQKCESNLSKNISSAVIEAKKSRKGIATVMVSCRYSDTGSSDDGHTICIVVNTDKFDQNGELLEDPSNSSPNKLEPEDFAIIDSSRAIINKIQGDRNYDNGIKEINFQLNSIIDTIRINEYSLYEGNIQFGPKCSDYARRAYQKLHSGNYLNVKDLRKNFHEFAKAIHTEIKEDYKRVFGGKNNIPGFIEDGLAKVDCFIEQSKPSKTQQTNIMPNKTQQTNIMPNKTQQTNIMPNMPKGYHQRKLKSKKAFNSCCSIC